jgi:hypothetical protein
MKEKLLLPLLFCCTLAHAQTAQELLSRRQNTENITTYGMGYDMKRYSPLRQYQYFQRQAPCADLGARAFPTTSASRRSR